MHYLLKENGILTGVLFNHTFEQGPPFGGDIEEYQSLFNSSFEILELAPCQNSVTKRTGMEAQFRFQKKSNRAVNLYQFTGITCSGCMKTVVEKFIAIPNVISANMSSDFKEVLIVSTEEIPLSTLQNAVSYDAKYSIQKIDAFS